MTELVCTYCLVPEHHTHLGHCLTRLENAKPEWVPAPPPAEAPKCVHCGETITDQLPGPSHLTGKNRWLNRCSPTDSGQEYGYAAHPPGTECPGHCLGAGKVARNVP
jgi:hypothetical protein